MKHLFLSTLLLLNALAAAAQADSIRVWNKWCLRADTALLFPTANNEIQLVCPGYHAADLLIKSLDNALKVAAPDIKGDTISMLAMPYPKYGKRMRLTVSDKKTRKLLKTITFTAADVPEPLARLGNITTKDAAKKDILAQSALRVVFAESLYNYPYRVKGYTFKTRIAGRDIQIAVKGFFITTEILTILSNAPIGTFIEFTNIEATCPDCNTRTLPDLKMWVR